MRTGFVVLAFFALMAVLARPICDAAHSPGSALHDSGRAGASYVDAEAAGHDDSETCCTTVDDGSLVVGTILLVPDVRSPSAVALAKAPSTRDLNRPSFRAPLPPERPPITRPYHARSARILT